ncbi:hypothetical protein WJX74_001377 [Apatococcus lobatus]|uniref:Glutathione peroxidase n=1 Tax=Apatococcus lobatus TaxID=904363 RepID=A0AAW1RUL7_9CHLO
MRSTLILVLDIAETWWVMLQNSNYPSLKTLYQKYKDQGFTLLAFSCNQFGGQAPRSSQGEREFAYKKFGIDEFPVMDKIDVNGEKVHPVYKLLRDALPNSLPNTFSPFGIPLPGEKGKIEWNYVKFLVDRDGKPVRRYTSTFDPIKAEDDLRLVLAGKPPRPEKCVGKPEQAGCKPDL